MSTLGKRKKRTTKGKDSPPQKRLRQIDNNLPPTTRSMAKKSTAATQPSKTSRPNTRTSRRRENNTSTRTDPLETSIANRIETRLQTKLHESSEDLTTNISNTNEPLCIIDDRNSNDPAYCVPYVFDIMNHLIACEGEGEDYMQNQKEVNATMRGILINWIIEVSQEYKLSQETLYLSKKIIDHVLGIEEIPRQQLQLLGIVSLLLASKYEDVETPPIKTFAYISDGTCSPNEIIDMEKKVLGDYLKYHLTFPTEPQFLSRFLAVVSEEFEDEITLELEQLASFYCENTLLHYPFTFYKPSTISLSSVCLALYTLNRAPWSDTLEIHSRQEWSNPRFRECLTELQNYIINLKSTTLTAVSDKYDLHSIRISNIVPTTNIFDKFP
mmetsp:Transcript_20506/g.43367  ORF Transcript_20506/g.43367 Transcript_20506/m.43367 type:complete len:384 (+) Transcript_20506:35-1186(+)